MDEDAGGRGYVGEGSGGGEGEADELGVVCEGAGGKEGKRTPFGGREGCVCVCWWWVGWCGEGTVLVLVLGV